MVHWSEFLAVDLDVRVRFPSLLDVLKSNGSETESSQPRDYNWGATWKKRNGSGLEIENTSEGIRHADHVASSIRKSWH
jgi:hypothetical protein